MSARVRRLQAEYELLQAVLQSHDRIRLIDATGRPPERYTIEFRVRSLVEADGQIVERDVHRAEITLGPDYPRQMPRCTMLTPVFHPNIDHLAICTEDIGAAGQPLYRTVIFIAEMLAFQAYNLQSPRNGDAARWVPDHLDRLPLDEADLFPGVLLDTAVETQATPVAMIIDPSPGFVSSCANCGNAVAAATPCPAGHVLCDDCQATCANCAAPLCLSCATIHCRSCQALVCRDCAVACARCGSWACVAHMTTPCQLCAATSPQGEERYQSREAS